ncbi:MAG: hypothetical protein M5U14_11205 [Acidimicrobiia bacterium]|nr:hypothetical protein [Acidimicrobiia bacterium]
MALVVAGIVALTGGEGDAPEAAEIFAEPISSLGVDPFTASVSPGEEELEGASPALSDLLTPLGELAEALPTLDPEALPPTEEGEVPSIDGSVPGLYGGTNELSVCDPGQLVDFLLDNPGKAAAWAGVLGLRADEIPDYVAGLTDVILKVDTRVTNHGFRDGRANGFQSVLQAGTAVLVDIFGVPVVRCQCGNPLLPPRPVAEPEVRGTVWVGFDVTAVVVVSPVDEVVEFVLDDVVSRRPLYRLPGSDATEATFEPTVIEPVGPTTTAPATSTTTTAPAAPSVLEGRVTSGGNLELNVIEVLENRLTFRMPDGPGPVTGEGVVNRLIRQAQGRCTFESPQQVTFTGTWDGLDPGTVTGTMSFHVPLESIVVVEGDCGEFVDRPPEEGAVTASYSAGTLTGSLSTPTFGEIRFEATG